MTNLDSAQSKVLNQIVNDQSLSEVLREVIIMIEAHLEGIVGSILLLDEDGQRLKVVAAPHLPEAYNQAIDGIAIGPLVGSCGTSAYRREPVFVGDIATDPLWVNFRDLALANNLRACWSIPILSKSAGTSVPTLLGTFACYSPQPGLPPPEFVELLTQAGNLVRLAVERERQNARLQASESRYRAFVDHATDAFFLVTTDLKIADVNNETCRSLGYTRNELIGASPTRFCQRWSDDMFTDGLQRPRHDEVVSFDSMHVRKDGTTFPVEIRVRPGEVNGRRCLIAFARDITERLNVERTLRESETFLRLSQTNALVGSWEWDVVTNRVQWSEEMARIHGISLSDFDGTIATAAGFIVADDQATFKKSVEHLFLTGEFRSWEYRARRADGKILVLWPTASVVRDETGKIVKLLGVSVDVTERIEAQRAIQESEQRFRQLSESAFEGLMIHERGVILVANRKFAEIFGYSSSDELINRSYFDLPLTSRSREIVKRQLVESHDEVFEVKIERPDGSIRTIETHGRDIIYDGRMMRVAAFVDVTEQKRDEISLRLFRTLVDKLEDALEIIDAPTGRFLDMNERECKDLGYTRDELRSMTVSDIDPLVDRDFYMQKLQEVRNAGSFKLETVHRRKDGSCFPVEVSVSMFDHDREYMLAVVRNISERKKHEQALRESEEKFRNAFDFAAIGMAILSLEGHFLKVNLSFCNFLGYTAEELLTRTFQEVTHPDDLDVSQLLVQELVAGSMPNFHLEKRYVHKSGRTLWGLLSVSIVRTDEGLPVSCIAQIQDVTHRKAVEKKLADTNRSQQEALALLDTLQASAPVGLAFVDRNFRFVRCNEALAEIDGVPVHDHLGKDVANVIPHVWDAVRASYEYVLAGNGPVLNREIIGETAAAPGIQRHWLANYYPVQVGTEIIGIGVIISEITALRKLEQQLQLAHKMEAIGRLARGVAHDFNNLLTVIQGHCGMLMESISPAHESYENCIAIYDACHRATAIVRQLLTFSRGHEAHPTLVDVRDALRDTESFLRRLLGVHVELMIDLGSEPATIRIDRSQLQQLFLNMTVNARDAIPHKGCFEIQLAAVEFTMPNVGPSEVLPVGHYVRLTFRDDGEGMNSEVKARIFEPFFTTKDVGKGTGLGLSVVHGIVKQSAGRIDVESEPGQGACFTIYLPRASENP